MTATSAAIAREVGRLLPEAEAWFSVVVHRDVAGNPVPTVTIFAEGMSRESGDEIQGHVRAIADVLRRAYAPKEMTKP